MDVDAVQEVASKSCWSTTEAGYLIELRMEHQIEPEVVNLRRQADAEHQRRSRLKHAERSTKTSESQRDNRRDETRDSGRVGSGRDENTHLREELNQPDIQKCIECGVDPGGCFEHWSSLESDLRLQETLETKW